LVVGFLDFVFGLGVAGSLRGAGGAGQGEGETQQETCDQDPVHNAKLPKIAFHGAPIVPRHAGNGRAESTQTKAILSSLFTKARFNRISTVVLGRQPEKAFVVASPTLGWAAAACKQWNAVGSPRRSLRQG